MDIERKEFTEAMALAVAEGMKAFEHEREEAKQRGAENDPLSDERISKMIDEQVSAKLVEAQKAYDEKLARLQAESNRVDPVAAKYGLGDVWPLPPHMLTRAARDETEKTAQRISDVMCVLGKLAKDPVRAARAYLDFEGIPSGTSLHKALDTYTVTGGAEWVPTIFSAQMIADIDEQARVAPLFPRITLAGKNVTMPAGSGLPTIYRTTGAENANVTEDTTQLSDKVEFSAEDIRGYRGYSDNLDEDSIVSVGPYLVSRLSVAFAQAIDQVILDGDTAATGIDGAIANGNFLRSWDGLRHKALTDDDGNVDLGTFTLDMLVQMPAAMGKYADDPARMAWIMSSYTYWSKLFSLKDSKNNAVFLPCNVNPNLNPIVNGQVGFLLGIPVVPSGLVRNDLNASGQYDGSTTDNSVVLLVNRDAWVLGDRRQLSIETAKDILSGLNKLVMTWRGDFQHLYGHDLTTVMGKNVDTA